MKYSRPFYKIFFKYLKVKPLPARLNLLNYAAETMDDPIAKKYKPEVFLKYREQRIDSGISAKAVNNLLGYINAVFNELQRN